MTFACPSAIASRAALDVFVPVIAALSSSWDVFNSSVAVAFSNKFKRKNNALTFLPRRCFVKEKPNLSQLTS